MSSKTKSVTKPNPAKHILAASNSSTSTPVVSSPVIVATPSTISIEPEDERDMEKAREEAVADTQGTVKMDEGQKPELSGSKDESSADHGKHVVKAKKKKKNKDEKRMRKSKRVKGKVKKGKSAKADSSDDETSSDSDSSSSSDGSSSDDESSEDEKESHKRKKKALKKKAEKKKAKAKAKKKKSKKYDASSDDSNSDSSASSDSDSDSDSDFETDKKRRKRKSKKKSKSSKKDKYELPSSSSESSSSDEEETKANDANPPAAEKSVEDMQVELEAKKAELAQLQVTILQKSTAVAVGVPPVPPAPEVPVTKKKGAKSGKGRLEYKRVDQVWDTKLRDYKITESAGEKPDEFDCVSIYVLSCVNVTAASSSADSISQVFTVRRKFNWENKYQYTLVDIKSNHLKDALIEVLRDVKGQSLEEEVPAVSPPFLYFSHV